MVFGPLAVSYHLKWSYSVHKGYFQDILYPLEVVIVYFENWYHSTIQQTWISNVYPVYLCLSSIHEFVTKYILVHIQQTWISSEVYPSIYLV